MNSFRNMISYLGISNECDYPSDPLTYKQFTVFETALVPEQKPDIEHLTEVMTDIEISSIRILHTPYDKKAIVTGMINQRFIYTADLPQQSVHSFHISIPFCEIVILKKIWDCVKIKIFLEDVDVFFVDKRTLKECKVLCLVVEKALNCSSEKNNEHCFIKHKSICNGNEASSCCTFEEAPFCEEE
ncbi:DUF3794 domain-containing protein [Tepidibacillus marianensis]|uniref:DUF3794 domain-containing protein n=1 Tax=Tepidibacillus marianensis TaxID=3131995 RepID=UPI0030D2111A